MILAKSNAVFHTFSSLSSWSTWNFHVSFFSWVSHHHALLVFLYPLWFFFFVTFTAFYFSSNSFHDSDLKGLKGSSHFSHWKLNSCISYHFHKHSTFFNSPPRKCYHFYLVFKPENWKLILSPLSFSLFHVIHHQILPIILPRWHFSLFCHFHPSLFHHHHLSLVITGLLKSSLALF